MLRNPDSRRRTTPWVSGLAVLLLAGFLVFRPYAWAQPPGDEAAGPSAAPAPAVRNRRPPSQPVAPAIPVTPPTGLFDISNAFALGWLAAGGWCPSYSCR